MKMPHRNADMILEEAKSLHDRLKAEFPEIAQLLDSGTEAEIESALQESPGAHALCIRMGELLTRAKAILDPYNEVP